MKKQFILTISIVLCTLLLISCGKDPVESGPSGNSVELEHTDSPSLPAWSADTIFAPIEEFSWPQASLDADWPETGFDSSVAELAFDGLDLKNTFSIGFLIAYEDERVLIFWSQQGIFGVELDKGYSNARVVFSLDFNKLFGRDGTIQGSHCTTIAVRKDGTRMVVGDWDETYSGPMKDWYLVDIPTLTYEKAVVHSKMTSAYEPKDDTFWTNEVFGSTDAAGWVHCPGCLGEAVYTLEDKYGYSERVIPLFKNYMEFTPFP